LTGKAVSAKLVPAMKFLYLLVGATFGALALAAYPHMIPSLLHRSKLRRAVLRANGYLPTEEISPIEATCTPRRFAREMTRLEEEIDLFEVTHPGGTCDPGEECEWESLHQEITGTRMLSYQHLCSGPGRRTFRGRNRNRGRFRTRF